MTEALFGDDKVPVYVAYRELVEFLEKAKGHPAGMKLRQKLFGNEIFKDAPIDLMIAEWCTEKGVLIKNFQKQDMHDRAKMISAMYINSMKMTLDRYVDDVREKNEKARNNDSKSK